MSLVNRSMLTRVASIAHVGVSFYKKTLLITCGVVAAAVRQLEQLVVKSIIITQQSYIRGLGVINIALLSIERERWMGIGLQRGGIYLRKTDGGSNFAFSWQIKLLYGRLTFYIHSSLQT